MRRLSGSIAVLGAALLVALGIAACGGGGVPSSSVAVVNGKSIKKSTFDHWLAITSASRTSSSKSKKAKKPVAPEPPHYTACIARLRENEAKPAKGASRKSESALKSECAEIYKVAKQEAVAFLIAAEWLIGEAKDRKISVSNKTVYKTLATEKKSDYPKESEFKELLVRSGQTVSDIALRLKLDLLSKKIEESVLKKAEKPPGKAAIAKYYDAHKSKYGTPERRDLKIVLTKNEAQAKSAKREIEAGKSFASVAKAVSIETASKDKGGVLDDVEKGQEQKTLGDAVFSASPNVLSGPVKTPFGYYVFEVTKVLKATQKPLKSVEAELKQTLTTQHEDAAGKKFSTSFKKKWKAKTECRTGFVIEDCKNYTKPKTTKSSTSATSTASK